MRVPKRVGAPIDARRYQAWLRRFGGYRTEVSKSAIEKWLQQFDEADRDLAARTLDAVDYVTHAQIEASFQALLGRLPGWNVDPNRRSGRWRFVAYSRAAGESGDAMLQKFRSAAGLGSNRYNDLFIAKSELLMSDLGPEDTVVFVDDFAGTGKQVCDGWNDIMRELLPREPNSYLMLVACSAQAKSRIEVDTDLKVATRTLLVESDNIFASECRYFASHDRERLLQYCKRANRKEPRGFGECGFVFVLAHKTPNNSLPILHAKNQRWAGLFPRA